MFLFYELGKMHPDDNLNNVHNIASTHSDPPGTKYKLRNNLKKDPFSRTMTNSKGERNDIEDKFTSERPTSTGMKLRSARVIYTSIT